MPFKLEPATGLVIIVAIAAIFLAGKFFIKPYLAKPSVSNVTCEGPGYHRATVTGTIYKDTTTQISNHKCYIYSTEAAAKNSDPDRDPGGVPLTLSGGSTIGYTVSVPDPVGGDAKHYAVVWVLWYNSGGAQPAPRTWTPTDVYSFDPCP
jgi:hypothetical protein